MSEHTYVVRVRRMVDGKFAATLWERIPRDECNPARQRFVREAYAEDAGRAVLLAAGNVAEHDVEVAG
jgi:hypothetical protein